jgi:hypothetical protein
MTSAKHILVSASFIMTLATTNTCGGLVKDHTVSTHQNVEEMHRRHPQVERPTFNNRHDRAIKRLNMPVDEPSHAGPTAIFPKAKSTHSSQSFPFVPK